MRRIPICGIDWMSSLSHFSSFSTTTRKRIACSQIREGMFLVRILDSWWKSPYFVHRRLLRSGDVAQLLASGIQEVEIDLSKGLDVDSDTEDSISDNGGARGQEVKKHAFLNDESSQNPDPCPLGSPFERQKKQERLVKLRQDTISSLEHVFEGVKTGRAIPFPALHAAAEEFVRRAMADPVVLAEIMLIEHLEQFDQTLYAHVVDTAVISILIGLQLEWKASLLEEVAVAALLHDVGYMRLPLNLVQERWGKAGLDATLMQRHVEMGLALIRKKSYLSPEIIQTIGEHHVYQDGSGYPKGQGEKPLSASGRLLGLADYFDELLAERNSSVAFPPALAVRRMYQEAKNGKFPILYVEAMIRVFGVYPIGTLVKLSTGEDAVVVEQNPGVSVKPQVKIIRTPDGKVLDEPEVRNLAIEGSREEEIRIHKILNSEDPSLNLKKYFS